MIIEIDVTSTKSAVWSVPTGVIAKVRSITLTDTSGSANEIKLTDEGSYYDGTDFSSSFVRTIVDEKIGANATVYHDYDANNKDIISKLYAIGTGTAKVILDIELL